MDLGIVVMEVGRVVEVVGREVAAASSSLVVGVQLEVQLVAIMIHLTFPHYKPNNSE